VDDAASVRAEAARWRGTTAAERWRLAILAARDAMWAVQASGLAERVLEHVDPLPPSTVAALARMRRSVGWGDAGR
jgi:hypothetical protein